MKTFCFASSSRRGITSGLWYSRPRRCNSAISPRAALVDDAELLLDEGANLARVAGQARCHKGLQRRLLRHGKKAVPPTDVKAGQPLKPVLEKQPMPTPYRVVVEE